MTYASPFTLEAALDALSDTQTCVIAGGTDVYPAMKQGRRPQHFLDISRVSELAEIACLENEIRIGATATWTDIITADLPPAFDALKQAAREVGSLQIQNSGTIAGNLCNASPAADGIPPLLALDATIELASASRGHRRLSIDAFVKGVRQTALADDELVTAICVPTPPEGMSSGFEKLGSRRYLVISICMTAANLVQDLSGRITTARIAVGACSAVAQRVTDLENAVLGLHPDEVHVSPDYLDVLSPIDDVRGTGEYRLEAAAIQCARAIRKAARS